MAYSGTLVASGQGLGLVVATGASTELGRISAMVGGVESLTTPLLRQMDAFARTLTIIILAVAAGVGVFAAAARGYAIEHAFMAAVGGGGLRHSRRPAGGDDDHPRHRRQADG